MKNKKGGGKKWREAWMKVTIKLSCPKHNDIKRVVLLNDYTEALESKSKKTIWFCDTCGRRLVRNYGDINFILPDDFNTRGEKNAR